jgi:hypothetical protein
MPKPQVFLGGSCNPTTWRVNIAIPLLEKAGITYYNPQLDYWLPELVEVEAQAKCDAEVILMIIDDETRAVASMIEAAENIGENPWKVVLVIKEIGNNQVVKDQTITGNELQELNRARTYLRDIAQRHGVRVYDDIAEACTVIVARYNPVGTH